MCVCVCNTMEIVFYNAMLSPKKMLKTFSNKITFQKYTSLKS